MSKSVLRGGHRAVTVTFSFRHLRCDENKKRIRKATFFDVIIRRRQRNNTSLFSILPFVNLFYNPFVLQLESNLDPDSMKMF